MPLLGSGIPLVGRAAELRVLSDAFARAERSEAAAVLLSGDAGVGKTRLLTELGNRAAERGALVVTGRCLDVRDGGLPYLPFAEALRGLPQHDEVVAAAVRARPALGGLLPWEAGEDRAEGDRDGAPLVEQDQRRARAEDLGQLRLFDAVLGVLTDISRDRPVVLALEDLHWADGSTRNLLSFLLSRLRGQRLLVVATYREEDVHRGHPLRTQLAELVRLPVVERVELRPFGVADARTFVAALAEEPLSPEVVAFVASRSEGNPFFAEELLASGAGRDDLPAALADVLLARMESFSPEVRRVLRVVSVASEAVAHAALAEVSGLGELELDEALREAVQHHVLVIDAGCYQFRHALLREAVYGDLLPGERGRMHAAYAARIRSTAEERGKDARLAYHSMRSNDLPAALSALLRAADEAEGLGAPGSALRHVEQALEIWNAVPESGRPEFCDEVDLRYRASQVAGRAGEPERAIAFARSAVEALDEKADPDRASSAWWRLSEALMVVDSTFHEAVEAIEHAWRLVAGSAPSKRRAWVLATRARLLRGGETSRAEAARSAEAAVADARSVGAEGAEASALTTLGALADQSGDPVTARQRLHEAERKASAAGAIEIELTASYFHALSFHDQAELGDAADRYARTVERAEEAGLGWSVMATSARFQQLALDFTRGNWPDDQPDRQVSTGSSAVSAIMRAATVDLVVARGRFDEATRLVSQLRDDRRVDIWLALSAASGGIQLAYWQAEHRSAVERACEGMDWLDEQFPDGLGGVRLGALGIEASAAWAAEARRRGEADLEAEAVAAGERLLARVRECAARGKPRGGVLGPEGRAWLSRAEAAAGGLKGPAVATAWEEVVAAFSYGAAYEQAVCRWHHAEALLAEGETARAAAELELVHAFADRLGAVPLRSAVRELATRAGVELSGVAPRRAALDPFTDRERAVLERVALGRTNRQVGEELYISEKTVSVHLSRVMAKLGVSRRAEAVAVAYDRGLLKSAPG